ncbi:MAG: hypothetical protein Kow00133_16440 [Amphiplicatus sp.]
MFAAGLAAIGLAACASRPAMEAAPPRPPSDLEAGRILSHARAARAKDGCAEAAPAYRVVAAMGEGFEIAQSELGECLLAMTGATPAETALFRDEAVFWLTRAAYAGEARAQRRLALHSGAPDAPPADKAEALRWALVYERNAQAALYGLDPLPPDYVQSLRAALPAATAEAAERFAAEFSPIRMSLTPRRRARRAPAMAAAARPAANARNGAGRDRSRKAESWSLSPRASFQRSRAFRHDRGPASAR